MRVCKCVVIKLTFIHDLEANLIRNHPMRPKEFIRCWNIPIKSKEWIPNLTIWSKNQRKNVSYMYMHQARNNSDMYKSRVFLQQLLWCWTWNQLNVHYDPEEPEPTVGCNALYNNTDKKFTKTDEHSSYREHEFEKFRCKAICHTCITFSCKKQFPWFEFWELLVPLQ